jgi:hypothetical protein
MMFRYLALALLKVAADFNVRVTYGIRFRVCPLYEVPRVCNLTEKLYV